MHANDTAVCFLLLTGFFLVTMSLLGDAASAELPDYNAGMDKVRASIKSGELGEAEETLDALLTRYPGNREVLVLLARVHFWQKRYDEALRIHDELRSAENEFLAEERSKVLIAKALSEADLSIAKGETAEGERILRNLYEAGTDRYEVGYRLGMLYLKQREYVKAVKTYRELTAVYPDDADFRALLVESLILDGDFSTAEMELNRIPEELQARVFAERGDLLFRVKGNYAKVSGRFYEYTSGFGEEKGVSFELSQRIKRLTVLLSSEHVHRFGLDDTQLGIEIYSRLGENANRWGYLALSVSPDHEFLPETAFGGEVYQGVGGVELSIGYRRMNFTDSSVNMVMPGIIIYLPHGLHLQEKLYVVPDDWTFSLLSTLHYEYDYKLKGFLAVAFGNASERISSLQDTQKFATLAGTLGAEYRWEASWSAGIELTGEYRRDLYSRYGFSLFSRFWW